MNDRQPNSRHCFVCGVKNPFGLHLTFENSAPGEVTAAVTLPVHFEGYPGVAHGGIIAAMLDEVCGRVYMDGDPPRFMYTARLEVQYRKNTPVGQPLRVVGTAGKDRHRTATASGRLYGPDGVLLAEAEALLVEVPPEKMPQEGEDALGWRVYTDEELQALTRPQA